MVSVRTVTIAGMITTLRGSNKRSKIRKVPGIRMPLYLGEKEKVRAKARVKAKERAKEEDAAGLPKAKEKAKGSAAGKDLEVTTVTSRMARSRITTGQDGRGAEAEAVEKVKVVEKESVGAGVVATVWTV